MMLGVLVLAGARQEGPCYDVMVFGFCGLVMMGCLGFLLYLGFAGVFPCVYVCFFFFLFWCLFCILRGTFTLFINFFDYLLKKKESNACKLSV
jgi:hypothetical protein